MGSHGVALFQSSSVAMRAEALLGRAGLSVRLIPTPREISSDCGVALQFDWAEKERAEEVLAEGRVEVLEIHRLR